MRLWQMHTCKRFFKAKDLNVNEILPFGAFMTLFWSGLANTEAVINSVASFTSCIKWGSTLVPHESCQWCLQTQMSEQMTSCDSFICAETRLSELWTLVKSLGIVSDLSNFSPLRRREHHLSVSAGTRRTPCAVVVGPRPITSRSPPVASVGTLRSARESVSHQCFSNKTPSLYSKWGMWVW